MLKGVFGLSLLLLVGMLGFKLQEPEQVAAQPQEFGYDEEEEGESIFNVQTDAI